MLLPGRTILYTSTYVLDTKLSRADDWLKTRSCVVLSMVIERSMMKTNLATCMPTETVWEEPSAAATLSAI